MEHINVTGLVIWFHEEGDGVIVETGINKSDKVGNCGTRWIMDSFKPYVRHKEYEYQVLFSNGKGTYELSNYFFKNMKDWFVANEHLKSYECELFERSKIEVK